MDEVTNIMLSQIKEVNERDEGQILAELAGETIEEYIYEIEVYNSNTKRKERKVKLSWIGTREMARAKGNITLSDPIIEDQDGFLRVVIRATDLKRNVSLFGGCHQPKQQKIKVYDNNGKEVGSQLQDDPYYFTKGLSKAQRNVIQAIMPSTFMARMVDKFLVMAGREPLKQLPQPKAARSRVARELSEVDPAEITTLHQLETLAYNRWHIQPADMYNQLGCKGKADCTKPPFECYLELKAIYEEGGD